MFSLQSDKKAVGAIHLLRQPFFMPIKQKIAGIVPIGARYEEPEMSACAFAHADIEFCKY